MLYSVDSIQAMVAEMHKTPPKEGFDQAWKDFHQEIVDNTPSRIERQASVDVYNKYKTHSKSA